LHPVQIQASPEAKMSANKTTNCGVTQLSTHYQHEQRKEKTLAKRNNNKNKIEK
jgi:hypothetical protein